MDAPETIIIADVHMADGEYLPSCHISEITEQGITGYNADFAFFRPRTQIVAFLPQVDPLTAALIECASRCYLLEGSPHESYAEGQGIAACDQVMQTIRKVIPHIDAVLIAMDRNKE